MRNQEGIFPCEVSFLDNGHTGAPLSSPAKSCCFLLIHVVVDHQWQSYSVYVVVREGVQVRLDLQVAVDKPVVFPFQDDLKL